MTNDENSPNLMNTGKCMDSRNDRMLTVETLQKTNCAL